MLNNALSDGQQEEANSNSSVLLFKGDNFEAIMASLTETYGTAGYSIIFSLGKISGAKEFKNVAEEQRRLNIPMTSEGLLNKTIERLNSMGWGKFQVIKIDIKSSANIQINRNPFLTNVPEIR
jgi:hypothetical protein